MNTKEDVGLSKPSRGKEDHTSSVHLNPVAERSEPGSLFILLLLKQAFPGPCRVQCDQERGTCDRDMVKSWSLCLHLSLGLSLYLHLLSFYP